MLELWRRYAGRNKVLSSMWEGPDLQPPISRFGPFHGQRKRFPKAGGRSLRFRSQLEDRKIGKEGGYDPQDGDRGFGPAVGLPRPIVRRFVRVSVETLFHSMVRSALAMYRSGTRIIDIPRST